MSFRNSKTYDAFKIVNSAMFIVLGTVIVAQMIHGIGFHFQAVAGLILGLALITLGFIRLRARWS